MSEAKAFCPACKQDVIFQSTATATVCPACGASFDLATETVRKQHLTWRDGVVFVIWIFVPAAIALLAMLVIGSKQLDKMSGDASTAWIVTGLVLGFANSYCACSWLTGRFTKKIWLRVLVGVSLGLAVLSVNAVVGFFGGCAFELLNFRG